MIRASLSSTPRLKCIPKEREEEDARGEWALSVEALRLVSRSFSLSPPYFYLSPSLSPSTYHVSLPLTNPKNVYGLTASSSEMLRLMEEKQ